jgi:hypothetical protein
MRAQSSANSALPPRRASPDLHRREVSLGVGEDLNQALESLLATGNAVRAQGHLLREQSEQVAQAGPGLAAKCDVIFVAGIDLPPLAVETAAPASTGIIDELWLGNARRQACMRPRATPWSRPRGHDELAVAWSTLSCFWERSERFQRRAYYGSIRHATMSRCRRRWLSEAGMPRLHHCRERSESVQVELASATTRISSHFRGSILPIHRL